MKKNKEKVVEKVYSSDPTFDDPTLDQQARRYEKSLIAFWESQNENKEKARREASTKGDSLLHGRGGSTVWVEDTKPDYVYDEESGELWKTEVLEEKKKLLEENKNNVWRF